jgi:hypothetical protein
MHMEMSQCSSGKFGRVELKKDLLVLGLSYVLLGSWCSAGSHFFLASLWALPLTYVAALLIYAQLHRHYHAYSKSAFVYHLIGIAYSAMVGLSWVLYCAHHANHHRFNNGPGDWSKTTDARGHAILGWKYLLGKALRPFLLQLVPFLSLLGMKANKRGSLAAADECMRVLLRWLALAAFGLEGLTALLLWQLVFICTIMFLNYLQHFGVQEGYGIVWDQRLLNRLTNQLGYHDQHHQFPSYHDRLLPEIASRVVVRRGTGLFSIKTMWLFLFDGRGLSRCLAGEDRSQ